MKISINNTNSTPRYSTSFQALPLARYCYLGAKKDVVIYQLEKSDIDYMEHLVKNLDKFFTKYDIDNLSARQVIEEALNAGIEILKASNPEERKAKILMAFYDNEPSSILIGNVLKVDKNGNLHYSSRKNHARGETELDWLATWNKKIPLEGQATVYEYFNTLLKDGFKQCFVRSEIPGKSSALDFYTRMGFERVSRAPRPILRKNDNRYVIGNYDDKTDTIIPMKISINDITRIIKEKADMVMRKEIKMPCPGSLPRENFDKIA